MTNPQMSSNPKYRLCMIPRSESVGGMSAFYAKMARVLPHYGVHVVEDMDAPGLDGVLVIGGTRQVAALWRARRRGIPVVQRLDGMNWIHRRRRTGVRHYLRAERANALLAFIRARLATHVVYQSRFAKRWWERVYGRTRVPSSVVHNGVDLDRYSPRGPGERPADRWRLLVVEGRLGGGYEVGLEHALGVAEGLEGQLHRPIELMVAGETPAWVRQQVMRRARVPIHWAGAVPADEIPALDRSAHLLFAADVNPACPNTVIEALACGLPVGAFDTGAIPELVDEESGAVVAYGGDPWKLDPPDIPALVAAMTAVLEELGRYQVGARRRAEASFGLERMVEGYLACLGWER